MIYDIYKNWHTFIVPDHLYVQNDKYQGHAAVPTEFFSEWLAQNVRYPYRFEQIPRTWEGYGMTLHNYLKIHFRSKEDAVVFQMKFT